MRCGVFLRVYSSESVLRRIKGLSFYFNRISIIEALINSVKDHSAWLYTQVCWNWGFELARHYLTSERSGIISNDLQALLYSIISARMKGSVSMRK